MPSRNLNKLSNQLICLEIFWNKHEQNDALSKSEHETIEAAIEEIIFEYTKVTATNVKENNDETNKLSAKRN